MELSYGLQGHHTWCTCIYEDKTVIYIKLKLKKEYKEYFHVLSKQILEALLRKC